MSLKAQWVNEEKISTEKIKLERIGLEKIMTADSCPKNPCNKPTSCPNKKYAYNFGCSEHPGRKIVGDMDKYVQCSANPNSDSGTLYDGSRFKIFPLKIKLPLCAEFDKDTLYNTDSTNEKMYDTFCLYPKHKKAISVADTTIVKDTVCIFDIKKIHCDLAEALNEWNCLCDKQNEPCECKIKIRFSNRPEDFGG